VLNRHADRATVSGQREIEAAKDVGQLQRVSVLEGPLQHFLFHLDADEVVVCLRCIVAPGDLRHVEAELDFAVGMLVVGVGHEWAELYFDGVFTRIGGDIRSIGISYNVIWQRGQ
jgi:hypothetical protein